MLPLFTRICVALTLESCFKVSMGRLPDRSAKEMPEAVRPETRTPVIARNSRRNIRPYTFKYTTGV